MAKFGSYYNLCPLTDIKGLQGVSPDKEDGQVIVTYRRNLAIKYRIQDQRQVHSWRTKEIFSSPVVWCESLKKYFAVFGERYVRCWNGDEEYLDKLKKHKFNHNIKSLITVPANHQSFIIFTNGIILPLSLAMSQPNNDFDPSTNSIAGEVHAIMHCTVNTTDINKTITYIGTTISSDDATFKFSWTSFDCVKGSDLVVESARNTFELDRSSGGDDVRVMGSVLSEVEGEVCLMLLWSDGRLFQVHLHTVETSAVDVYGSPLQAWTNNVAMISLGDTQQHIAIFGEASAGEGALLALYGVRTRHFGPRLALKVRGDSRGGGLWHCGGERILVHVGQNLVVVPVQLAEQELAHLLGVDEDILEQAQVISQLDVARLLRVVDLDEEVVVCLVKEAMPETKDVLQIISKLAINEQRLVRALRKHLPFAASIALLSQLITSLSTTEQSDQECSIVWATCLLDANYQQVSIACADPDLAALIVHCCDVLKAHKMHLSTLRELATLLQDLKRKAKKGSDGDGGGIVLYEVEAFDLYNS